MWPFMYRCPCKNNKIGVKKQNGNTRLVSKKLMATEAMKTSLENQSFRNYKKIRCVQTAPKGATSCRVLYF